VLVLCKYRIAAKTAIKYFALAGIEKLAHEEARISRTTKAAYIYGLYKIRLENEKQAEPFL
jgi:hypothetical protein